MRSVEWEPGAVKMIDQRALPWKLEYVHTAIGRSGRREHTQYDRARRAGDRRGSGLWHGVGGSE